MLLCGRRQVRIRRILGIGIGVKRGVETCPSFGFFPLMTTQGSSKVRVRVRVRARVQR